jgi:archaellum component FlaC
LSHEIAEKDLLPSGTSRSIIEAALNLYSNNILSMTNTPIQVTTDLSTVLEKIDRHLDKIDGKLDGLQKELVDFKTETRKEIGDLKTETRKEIGDFKTETKVSIESLKGDIKTLDSKVSQTAEDVKELKSSQKAQIWSLIVLAFTAVLGLIAASAKILFVPNL